MPLIFHSIDSFFYHNNFHNLLPSVLESLQEALGAEPIFVDDNSKVHKKNVVKEWEE